MNVYVDGVDARERGGLSCPLVDAREVRIVAMISGGQGPIRGAHPYAGSAIAAPRLDTRRPVRT